MFYIFPFCLWNIVFFIQFSLASLVFYLLGCLFVFGLVLVLLIHVFYNFICHSVLFFVCGLGQFFDASSALHFLLHAIMVILFYLNLALYFGSSKWQSFPVRLDLLVNLYKIFLVICVFWIRFNLTLIHVYSKMIRFWNDAC